MIANYLDNNKQASTKGREGGITPLLINGISICLLNNALLIGNDYFSCPVLGV